MEKNKKELFEPEQLYKTEIGLASQLKSWCFYWKWFLLQEVLFRVAELGPATRDTCLRKWSYRDTDREFFIEENLGRKIWVPSNGVVYIKSSWPIGGRKLFSIRKFIHSESSKFLCLTISLLGKKKKKPRILAHFHTNSLEVPSEGVWMVTHPWVANGNSGTDHFESFMNSQPWDSEHCVWE